MKFSWRSRRGCCRSPTWATVFLFLGLIAGLWAKIWAWRMSFGEILCVLERVFLLNRNITDVQSIHWNYNLRLAFVGPFSGPWGMGLEKRNGLNIFKHNKFKSLWCSGENQTQHFLFILDIKMVFKDLSWQKPPRKYIVETHFSCEELQVDSQWEH